MLKIDAASVNSFTLLFNPLVMSLRYIRKGRGPNMDPWSTPARTVPHDKAFPINTTLWNKLEKVTFNNLQNLTEIPTEFNLESSPSCKSLSKVFDISKKTDLTLGDGVPSKNWKISCVTESNSFIYESDGRNQIDFDLRVVRFEEKCTFY